MNPTPTRRRQDTIASVVLLVLLALSLVHSHSHFGGLVGPSSFNTAISTYKGDHEGFDDKLQPCLACTCQKHAQVILSSFNLLPELLRVSHRFLEYQQTFVSQSSFNPVLSRAPPVLG